MKCYYTEFSHAYEDGPSGPAREYWRIYYGDPETDGYKPRSTLTLETRPDGQRYAEMICRNLDKAREMGRIDKQDQIAAVLGVKRHVQI